MYTWGIFEALVVQLLGSDFLVPLSSQKNIVYLQAPLSPFFLRVGWYKKIVALFFRIGLGTLLAASAKRLKKVLTFLCLFDKHWFHEMVVHQSSVEFLTGNSLWNPFSWIFHRKFFVKPTSVLTSGSRSVKFKLGKR